MRCDATGAACAEIPGQAAASYTLTSADVGPTDPLAGDRERPGGRRRPRVRPPTGVVKAAGGGGTGRRDTRRRRRDRPAAAAPRSGGRTPRAAAAAPTRPRPKLGVALKKVKLRALLKRASG